MNIKSKVSGWCQWCFRNYLKNCKEVRAFSCHLSAFCYAARCWGVSHVIRAQQRLYFWPEPQGHWAFRAGCGGTLTVLQCEPREAVSYQRSAVSLAQQRLYFWPEPQGHWAFLAGCGGTLTVLQCEPGEVYSSAKASDSRLCCRLSLMSEVSSTAFRTDPLRGRRIHNQRP